METAWPMRADPSGILTRARQIMSSLTGPLSDFFLFFSNRSFDVFTSFHTVSKQGSCKLSGAVVTHSALGGRASRVQLLFHSIVSYYQTIPNLVHPDKL